jgi:hypothetical protein
MCVCVFRCKRTASSCCAPCVLQGRCAVGSCVTAFLRPPPCHAPFQLHTFAPCARKKAVALHMLSDINANFKPGSMTLVRGGCQQLRPRPRTRTCTQPVTSSCCCCLRLQCVHVSMSLSPALSCPVLLLQILGAPGSGKTSFLKVVSGLASSKELTGKVGRCTLK